MPIYSYKCEQCKAIFDVRHGMFFESQRCIKCYSDEVYRIPNEINLPSDKNSNSPSKPGKIVDKYIEEAKEEIKKEKKRLKSEEM